MYKFIALFALFACAMAAPEPHLVAAAPAKFIAQPAQFYAAAPLASSYSNSYQKIHSAAPLIASAPVYAAAPAVAYHQYSAHAAPLAYSAPLAAAPVAYSAPALW